MTVVKTAIKPIIVQLPNFDENQVRLKPSHSPVYIESGDYIVRSLKDTDASEKLLGWLNRADMLRGLNLDKVDFNLSQLRAFIAGFDNYLHFILGIFNRNDEKLIGFYTIDVNRTHKTGSLTTGIGDTSERGKRTLWATIDAILDYFYAEREIEKFTARILARNYAMLFNFKNNTRFVLEAHLKDECLAPNGKRVDLLVFASFKNPRTQVNALPPRETKIND
ncbi:hypothetical protein KQ944_17785 [Bacillus subtilis]|uniref:GNAT family N-acetyltransferase n=1 Tax=Pseudochrobactrum asaccharolyticum TaxID=354351 RepID=UPI001F1F1F7C|nr:N-acetyltransferase [Pseudochrobactrum asaccharolyticum]MCF7647194.1 N-acetyltransferase [Pseudochrobactrum asaccharolyticum]MCF7673490.1 hypothetical protein [Bacillus subtilis]